MREHLAINPDLLISSLSGTAAALLAGVSVYAAQHHHEQTETPMPVSGCNYTQVEPGEEPGCAQFRAAHVAISRQELPQATDQYLGLALGGISLIYGYRYAQVRLVTREANNILKVRT